MSQPNHFHRGSLLISQRPGVRATLPHARTLRYQGWRPPCGRSWHITSHASTIHTITMAGVDDLTLLRPCFVSPSPRRRVQAITTVIDTTDTSRPIRCGASAHVAEAQSSPSLCVHTRHAARRSATPRSPRQPIDATNERVTIGPRRRCTRDVP